MTDLAHMVTTVGVVFLLVVILSVASSAAVRRYDRHMHRGLTTRTREPPHVNCRCTPPPETMPGHWPEQYPAGTRRRPHEGTITHEP